MSRGPGSDSGRDDAPGPRRDDEDARAPYLGRWSLLYAFVFLNLVVLIALFTWFTRYFE